MTVVVITGAPASGKTSLVSALLRRRLDVSVVPEVFSLLWPDGRRRTGRREQELVYRTHLELLFKAKLRGSVVICDRGTLDGLCYTSEAVFRKMVGGDLGTEYRRYGHVVMLGSIVGIGGDGYRLLRDGRRTESARVARRMEDTLYRYWCHHENFLYVGADADFGLKMEKGMRAVEACIGAAEMINAYDAMGHVTGIQERDDTKRLEHLFMSVHVVIYDRRRMFLMQKRSMAKAKDKGRWDILTGVVRAGEDSLAAAKREIMEELLVPMGDLGDSIRFEGRVRGRENLLDVFSWEIAEGTWIGVDSIEVAEVKFVGYEEILSMFREREDKEIDYRLFLEGVLGRLAR